MIRAGIIGWGENGEKIARALHFEIKDTEVVGVATLDEIGREFAMQKLGIKHIFSNYTNLLELHQIDVICICSEGDMHLTQVEQVISSGSNVFIDHPIASNVEDSIKMVKLLDSYPSYKTTVAFPRRFDRRLIQLKNDILQGKLGHIISIDCKTYEPMRPLKMEAVRKGIFMDLMLQDIDMVRWLTQKEYKSVYVQGNAIKYPSLNRQNDVDTAMAMAVMEDELLVSFFSSRVQHRGTGFEVRIVGTEGELRIDALTSEDRWVDSQDGKPFYLSYENNENEYIPLLKDYIDAVRHGNRLKYKLEDATDATRVAVAMTKSYLMGQEVKL